MLLGTEEARNQGRIWWMVKRSAVTLSGQGRCCCCDVGA